MAKAKPRPAPAPPAEAPAQPYYLQKAHVKDYRSVRDAEVEFKPGLNIIIGPNGAGKTNFLRAVYDSIIPAKSNRSSSGSSFSLGGRVPLHITYYKTEESVLDPFIHQEPIVQVKLNTANGEAIGNSVGEAALKLQGFSNYYVTFAQHSYPSKRFFPVLTEAPDLRLISTRPFGDIVASFPRSLLDSIHWATHLKRDTPLNAVEAKKMVTKLALLHLEILNAYLPSYSPVEAVRLDGLLQTYEDKIQNEVLIKGLSFEYQVQGAWWQFADLSDGTKRLIYFISELIAPLLFEASGDDFLPFERDKIILLEEPELGIHPHQLHLLLDLIRQVARKHQVIMTTHSPQVLNMLYLEELDRIIICELKDPKKGTQFTHLSKAKIAKAKRYMKEVGHLSDFWLHSDMESRSTVG